MKYKKMFICTLCICILIILCIGFYYVFLDSRTYVLNLPKLENLMSISLDDGENNKVISYTEEIDNILYVLNGKKRVSKDESIQDFPVGANDIIKIDFNFKEGGTSTIFVYEKKGKYYIEQPYNGIYIMLESEYNSIKEIIAYS